MSRSPLHSRHPYHHWIHKSLVRERAGGDDPRLALLWWGHPNKGWNREKAECPRGHPYTLENTLRNSQGARVCRECKRSRERRTKGGRE